VVTLCEQSEKIWNALLREGGRNTQYAMRKVTQDNEACTGEVGGKRELALKEIIKNKNKIKIKHLNIYRCKLFQKRKREVAHHTFFISHISLFSSFQIFLLIVVFSFLIFLV
jgi:hypothetical protein